MAVRTMQDNSLPSTFFFNLAFASMGVFVLSVLALILITSCAVNPLTMLLFTIADTAAGLSLLTAAGSGLIAAVCSLFEPSQSYASCSSSTYYNPPYFAPSFAGSHRHSHPSHSGFFSGLNFAPSLSASSFSGSHNLFSAPSFSSGFGLASAFVGSHVHRHK